MTTLAGSLASVRRLEEAGDISGETAGRYLDLHRRNLRLLHRNHVPIAFGSDQYRGSSSAELDGVSRLGVFDDATLLTMWCENTPRTIFPSRRIGRLQDGYEASFLVLRDDPIEDIRNVRSIAMRVEQGTILPSPE